MARTTFDLTTLSPDIQKQILASTKNVGDIFNLPTGQQIERVSPTGFLTVDTLPNLPAQPTPTTIGGITISSPFVNQTDLDRIRSETTELFEKSKAQTAFEYGTKISRAEEVQAAESRALGGALATERRFSTSAQAFIKYQESENQKQINDLMSQRDKALANEDVKMAQAISENIDKVYQRQRQQFQDTMSLIDFAQKQTKLEKESATAIATREGKVISLFNTGTTDVNSIIQQLNQAGGDYNVKEVSDIVSKLGSDTGRADLVISKPELFSLFAQTDTQREKLISEIYKKNPEFDFSQLLKPAVEENLYNATLKNPRLFDTLNDATQQAIISQAESEGYDTSGFIKPKEPKEPTAEEKALAYNAIKNKAFEEFNRFIKERTAETQRTGEFYDKKIDPTLFERMKQEIINWGLGSYIDDFENWVRDKDYLSKEELGKTTILPRKTKEEEEEPDWLNK